MALTIEQFGQQVKAKHPQYGDLPDAEVGRRVLEKYPQYQDMVESQTSQESPTNVLKASIIDAVGPQEKNIGGFLKNIPKSAGRFVGDLFSAVAHPIQTVKGLGTVGVGAVEKLIPGEQKHEKAADAVGQFFKERYGGVEAIKKTLYEDPVGALADISTLFTGGGALATKAGQLSKVSKLAKAGRIASRAGEIVEPTGIGVKALKAVASPPTRLAGRIAGETLGFTTGAGYGAVKEALRNPSPEFTAALRGEVSGENVLSSARDALESMRQQRGTAYQKELAGIAKQKGSLDISSLQKKLDQQLKAFNVKRSPDGSFDFSRSVIVDKAEANRVTEIVDTIKNWGLQKGDRTATGLDLLKRRLDDFYSPSGQARALVSSLRNTVKDILTKNVPGYYTMTADYAKSTDIIKEVEKALSLGDRVSADTAIRKLTSVLRENNDFRRSLVEKLQTASGTDLKGMIAGTALSQITPRGLTARLLSEGGIFAGFLVDPKFWAVLGVSSPRVAGEFLRYAGLGRKAAQKAMQAIQKTGATKPAVRQSLFQVGRLRDVLNERSNQNRVEDLKAITK
ncbi:MAG: hypothetical protein HYW91_02495 [Candidatus Sungbacteria bacterium]|nr:hypothetical protein [Candidatus Sungbacteria bacterium]